MAQAGIQYRRVAEDELAQVAALWAESFGDSPEYAESALQSFVGLTQVFVAVEAGRVLAQLMAVPCATVDSKGIYLYALATAKAAQGRGIMTALMQHAESICEGEGAAFSCLLPANTALFSFYEKRGYTLPLQLRQVVHEIKPNVLAQADFDSLTAKGFATARKQYMGETAILFDESRTAQILQDLYSSGATLAKTKQAYALYWQKEETVYVAELGAGSSAVATELLQAVREKSGCSRAVLTLPVAGGVFAGEGSVQPYGLLKCLGGYTGETLANAYFRFGFDEIWPSFER